MAGIGTVESVWRYPGKSMRGEELDEMYAGCWRVQRSILPLRLVSGHSPRA